MNVNTAELEDRMNEEGKHEYSSKHLKEKLFATFEDNVTISELLWENGMVSFRDIVEKL